MPQVISLRETFLSISDAEDRKRFLIRFTHRMGELGRLARDIKCKGRRSEKKWYEAQTKKFKLWQLTFSNRVTLGGDGRSWRLWCWNEKSARSKLGMQVLDKARAKGADRISKWIKKTQRTLLLRFIRTELSDLRSTGGHVTYAKTED